MYEGLNDNAARYDVYYSLVKVSGQSDSISDVFKDLEAVFILASNFDLIYVEIAWIALFFHTYSNFPVEKVVCEE